VAPDPVTAEGRAGSGAGSGGFRRLGEDEAFRGHVFSVGRARFEDPDGRPFERSVVHHPGAVAVIAVDGDRRAVLVRQFRAAVGTTVLEAPAGTRDVDGEPPEDTARRELAEEAGLEADEMREIADVFNSPGISDQRTVIFLATGLHPCGMDRAGVEEEWMTVERVALDDVDDMVAGGHLEDAVTTLGLHLARRVLGDGRR
jgi:ADP-ribose pyrophosphatase